MSWLQWTLFCFTKCLLWVILPSVQTHARNQVPILWQSCLACHVAVVNSVPLHVKFLDSCFAFSCFKMMKNLWRWEWRNVSSKPTFNVCLAHYISQLACYMDTVGASITWARRWSRLPFSCFLFSCFFLWSPRHAFSSCSGWSGWQGAELVVL